MIQAGLLLIIRGITSVQTAVGMVMRWLASRQSTQPLAIPIAVYTELMLLMMSSQPVGNM